MGFSLARDSILTIGISTLTSEDNLDAVILRMNAKGQRIDYLTLAEEFQGNDYVVSLITDESLNTYALWSYMINTYIPDDGIKF